MDTVDTWTVKGYHTETGAKFSLRLEAGTAEQAEQAARLQGMAGAKASQTGRALPLTSIWTRSPSRKERSKTLRAMATATDAGLNALDTTRMARQGIHKSRPMHRILLDMETRIKTGSRLQEAIAAHPEAFSETTVAVVEAGYASGDLSGMLRLLAKAEEAAVALRGQIIGALAYPIVVLVMVVVGMVYAVAAIIPQMADTLTEIGGELPAITRAAVSASDFLNRNANWLLITAPFLVGLLVAVLRTPAVRHKTSLVVWHLPILGNLVKAANEGAYCAIIGILLRASIEPSKAFDIASRTVRNHYYRRVTSAIPALMTNEALAFQEAIKANVPPLNNILVSLAGQSASGVSDLGEPWARYGQIQTAEAKNLASTLTTAIQPLVYVIVGGAVLVFVLVLYSPMLEVLKTLS